MEPHASSLVAFGIGGIALVVALVSVVAYRHVLKAASPVLRRQATFLFGAIVASWMTFTAAFALSGHLANFGARPPSFAVILLGIIGIGLGIGLSRVGQRFTALPLWGLVLFQSFRLPLELVMHQAAVEGTMPNVMSFTGRNFDIVTGATAIVMAVLLRAKVVGRRGALVWNMIGTLLLINVMQVAVRATPLFHAFGNESKELNTWVAFFPFVWLPAVLVTAALAGHIIVFRKLVRGDGP